MAGKRQFNIGASGGTVFTQAGRSGSMSARLEWKPGFESEKNAGFSKAQDFVDSECIRRMNPDTPERTGVLKKSATLGTVIGSGEIEQVAPYARKQYYEHKEKSFWFERMKNRNKDSILKGAAKYVAN